jgi:hypothetical protein
MIEGYFQVVILGQIEIETAGQETGPVVAIIPERECLIEGIWVRFQGIVRTSCNFLIGSQPEGWPSFRYGGVMSTWRR